MGVFVVVLINALLSISWGQELKTIHIDLAQTGIGETRTEQFEIANSTIIFEVSNANPNKIYFILQIHTFSENVTLSSDALDSLTGTNIGLAWGSFNGSLQTDNVTAMFYLKRTQPINTTLAMLAVINVYSTNDPVPGGCNLSFNNEIAPYLLVNQEETMLTVLSQPPLDPLSTNCELINATTQIYYLYLEEHSHDADSYFKGIQKMSTVANIEKYGYRLSSSNQSKQRFNRYVGIGRIFAVVAELNGRKAAYVPTVSFGCDVNHWAEDCVEPIEAHWKWIVSVLLIWGIFTSFFGHRFFKSSVFMVAYIWGVFITFVLISLSFNISSHGMATISLITGIFFGLTAVFFWWKYGSPYWAILPSFAMSGFLIISIIFYTPIADKPIFQNNLIFWSTFASSVLLVMLFLTCIYPIQHIIALSSVGSYAAVVALNYYTSGYLPYIVINMYRRMTVKDFNFAIIDPPFQLIDASHVLTWAAVFILGLYNQIKRSIGRPPFPSQRRRYFSLRPRRMWNETTSLLNP